MTLELSKIGVAEFALRAGTQPGWSVLVVDAQQAQTASDALLDELRDIDDSPVASIAATKPADVVARIQSSGAATIVMTGLDAFDDSDWHHLDLLRSRLARDGCTILVLSSEAMNRFAEAAPNLASWLGATVWRADLSADTLSMDEVEQRLVALRETLRKASDDSILQNPPHEAFHYVKKTRPPADARAIRGALAIVGGEENQHRSKERKHFLRTDGAWFDFTITLARTARGPLVLLAYDFELRFPGPHPPAWIRIDLNLPGHDNDKDGLRSHLHPGNDDLQAPAPVLGPLELLDLCLHGFRGREKPRRKGSEAVSAVDAFDVG